MIKLFVFITVIISLGILLIIARKFNSSEYQKTILQNTENISVVLDWTPNTNHTGLYVAIANNYFREENLEVKILPFSQNVSPDVLVSSGKADIGIGAVEGVVSDAVLGAPVVSIASITAHNTSALMVLESSGIKRPKDLSGKIYGGYGSPFEDAVVGQIIRKDGGNPNIKNITLTTEALKALETKKVDFIWGFLGWEEIQAKREGFNLKSFPVIDYGISDSYTPIYITSPKLIQEKPLLLKKFLKALSKGYNYAIENPKEAAKLLIAGNPEGTFPDEQLVFESQAYLSTKYKDNTEKWGFQKKEYWTDYSKFILGSGKLKDQNGKTVSTLDSSLLYSNDFLPDKTD